MVEESWKVPVLYRVGIGPFSENYQLLVVFGEAVNPSSATLFVNVEGEEPYTISNSVDAISPFSKITFTIENPGPSKSVQYCVRGDADLKNDSFNTSTISDVLENEQTKTFKTLPPSGPRKIALISCNGLKKAPESKPSTFLWNDLSDTIDGETDDSADLLVMAGDQVYADGWALDLESLNHTQDDYDAQNIPYEDLLTLYRKRYVEVWGNEDVQDVLARIPSVAMWDDHDIYNGYGSWGEEEEYDQAYQAAEKSFQTFQGNVNPDPSLGFDSETSKAYSLRTENAGVIVLDGRTNRNFDKGKILGDGQIHELENVLEKMTSEDSITPEHLFVVVGVPFLYLRNVLGEGLELIEGLEESDLKSDVNDGWRWGDNIQEFRRVMNLIFKFQRKTEKPKISILSGDVHLAMKAYLLQENAEETVEIPQVTSSGIGYHPPGSLTGFAFEGTFQHSKRTQLDRNIFGQYKLVGTNSEYFLLDQWTLAKRNYCVIDTDRTHDEGLQFYYRAEGEHDSEDSIHPDREKSDLSNNPKEEREIERLEERNIGRLNERL